MSNIDQREALAIINANEQAEIRAFDTHAKLPEPVADPLRVQLLALYDASAEADKLLLFQIAVLHAARNAARGK